LADRSGRLGLLLAESVEINPEPRSEWPDPATRTTPVRRSPAMKKITDDQTASAHSDADQQRPLAAAFYNGRNIVLELNDEGFDALSVGSVELTPAQARSLIAELQASVTKAETSR
jgi:hypothetical protein